MILSVSRRTDIPAFYCDWFFDRLKDGFVLVPNPINQTKIAKIKLEPLKKEDIVHMCIQEMGATKNDCILVGDTDNDARGAVKAETSFIAVTYGFGFKSEKDVSMYPHIGVARTPSEVAEIILRGNR